MTDYKNIKKTLEKAKIQIIFDETHSNYFYYLIIPTLLKFSKKNGKYIKKEKR